MYLDANNLQCWAMGQYLPYSRFTKQIENSSDEYILEVDLEYPDKLHELYNDYLLGPEKLEISHNLLSNYCSNITNKYDIKCDGVNKLLPSLDNKSKYFLHYKSLHLYFLLRMELVKTRKIVKLKQSDWLKK